MIEPEVAFADLDDVADLGRDYIQFMIKAAMEKCPDELALLSQRNDPTLLETLTHVASSPFAVVVRHDTLFESRYVLPPVVTAHTRVRSWPQFWLPMLDGPRMSASASARRRCCCRSAARAACIACAA